MMALDFCVFVVPSVVDLPYSLLYGTRCPTDLSQIEESTVWLKPKVTRSTVVYVTGNHHQQQQQQ